MKILTSALCLLLCGFNISLWSDLPEPYQSNVDLPFDGHGWFMNAEQLQVQLSKKPAKVVIEVGSWLGCSTRFIASAIPDGGVVYAVDTWLGSSDESLHLQDPRLPYLYQQFLSNVKHAGLTSKIIPVRMRSLEAASGINVKADLIYIDAGHDTASVFQDIMAWYPHLNQGGIMCGDDWGWLTVQSAVIMGANQLGKRVCASGNFWWYE